MLSQSTPPCTPPLSLSTTPSTEMADTKNGLPGQFVNFVTFNSLTPVTFCKNMSFLNGKDIIKCPLNLVCTVCCFLVLKAQVYCS